MSLYFAFLLGCMTGILMTLLIEYVIQTRIRLIEKPPDLFEIVRQKVGCVFISDLPYHSKMVKKILSQMDLNQHTIWELQDMFWYVFKIHLHSKKEMIEFLKKEA